MLDAKQQRQAVRGLIVLVVVLCLALALIGYKQTQDRMPQVGAPMMHVIRQLGNPNKFTGGRTGRDYVMEFPAVDYWLASISYVVVFENDRVEDVTIGFR